MSTRFHFIHWFKQSTLLFSINLVNKAIGRIKSLMSRKLGVVTWSTTQAISRSCWWLRLSVSCRLYFLTIDKIRANEQWVADERFYKMYMKASGWLHRLGAEDRIHESLCIIYYSFTEGSVIQRSFVWIVLWNATILFATLDYLWQDQRNLKRKISHNWTKYRKPDSFSRWVRRLFWLVNSMSILCL